MERLLRPSYAEVDIGALRFNYRQIKELVSPAAVMPVVKANAYGHGAVETARALETENPEMLGVATIEEGTQLREAGIKSPILVLGSVYPFKNFRVIIEYGLTPVVASLAAAKALEEAAEGSGKKVFFHLEVDTGMGRTGISPQTAADNWNHLKGFSHTECEGVFTHLACAGEDLRETEKQLGIFRRMLEKISPPRYIHVLNTAGMLTSSGAGFNMVRPGLAIYGLCPDGVRRQDYPFKPVLSLKSAVIFLKEVPGGIKISYGGTWKAPRKTLIATLCAGYADGYRRELSNKAGVIINGTLCPVVGRVCMDMIMVDVTAASGVRTGDEAVLMGSSGGVSVTAEDLAGLCGTVNYEILTGISSRVPRVYRGL